MSEKNRKLLLTLLGLAHSLNHSLFLVLPLYLLDVASEFATTKETIGLIAAISGFIYGAGSLVGGRLSDRLGEIKAITLSSALAGASTFIFIAARNLEVFSIGLLSMSAWASIYHPTANSIISKVFPTNMAEAMGLHGTGGNIGYMFTPLVTVAIGDLLGWRYPLIFYGFLCIFASVLIIKGPSISVEKEQADIRMRNVIRVPGLWILLVYNVIVGLYFKGIEFIFPTFLQEREGFSSALKGVAVFCLLATGILGQWLGGRASDSFGSKKTLIITSIGVLLSLLLLLVVPIQTLNVAVFVLLYGFFFYGHQPALNSLAGQITPKNLRGTMYGVLFFFSFGLGSASIAMATLLAALFGLEVAFYALAMLSVVALLISIFAPISPEHSRKREQYEETS